MNKKLLYPLACAIINAVIFLLNEYVLSFYSLSPLVLAFFVTVIGGIFLFFFVDKKVLLLQRIMKRHFFLFLLSAFFTYALSFILAFSSMSFIGATKFSFAVQLEALFIIPLSFFFLREKITFRSGSAAFLIFVGGFFLSFSFETFTFHLTKGDIFAILSALSFSVGIIMTAYLLQQYDALFLTALGLLVGSFFLFLYLFLFLGVGVFFLSSSLLFLLVFSSGIGEGFIWLLYNKGLHFVGAPVTSIIFSTLPFFTLLVSYFFNAFVIADFFILPQNLFSVLLGGMLMFIGIVVVYYKSEKTQNTSS